MNDNRRDPVSAAAQSNPELAKAISRLSAQDMARLREVLADPEKTRQVLSTPMAQQMLSRLGGAKEKNND